MNDEKKIVDFFEILRKGADFISVTFGILEKNVLWTTHTPFLWGLYTRTTS